MEYQFGDIEKKWQQRWTDAGIYKVTNDTTRPKYYVLDMFPYPSGAGLHVGHPLGYIASDIFARYKRLRGFNVLHPMGYDAFGLPAEQYAIERGIHPAVSTDNNIANFRQQLDNIGFVTIGTAPSVPRTPATTGGPSGSSSSSSTVGTINVRTKPSLSNGSSAFSRRMGMPTTPAPATAP